MKNWLNSAIVYEVYPQSFYDTNGDGIGDLRGIIEKLDYIDGCGFNALWLHPINESSFRDGGYDITDYYKVASRYGTNDDFKELCERAHARGIKIIFDLVAGHTSIDHPWFIESAKAEKNEYTNRYIWTEGTFDGGNGIRGFSQRDGIYMENFFWCQPALNYGFAHPQAPWQLPVSHPDCVATKEELKKIIYFWMDMGVDAFRVDLAPTLIKGDVDGSYTKALWHEIRSHIETKNKDCLLISEWGKPALAIQTGFHCDFLLHCYTPAYTSLFRYEEGRNVTKEYIGHSYFDKEGKGNISVFLDHFLKEYEKIGEDGVIGLITGNHDMQRIGYRRSQDELKLAMLFIFTMPGVPFIYYGDEIGMDFIEGLPSKEGGYIRTGSRTPMQWNHEKNHGFSNSDTPYLPTDSREGAPTVEEQLRDTNSLLSFVKKLILLRKANPELSQVSDLNILLPSYPLVYERTVQDKKLFIAINPSGYRRHYDMPNIKQVIFSQNIEVDGSHLVMEGNSYIVAEEE